VYKPIEEKKEEIVNNIVVAPVSIVESKKAVEEVENKDEKAKKSGAKSNKSESAKVEAKPV